MVNSGTNIFDSLTYRSDTGDYIGKFTFHTGVRYDVPGGGGGDCRGLGKMFLHQSTGRKKRALIRWGSDFAQALAITKYKLITPIVLP